MIALLKEYGGKEQSLWEKIKYHVLSYMNIMQEAKKLAKNPCNSEFPNTTLCD